MTGKLLRIFVGEDDRYDGRPLYMAIVDALRDAGFTGATVLKGIEGYGRHGAVHSTRLIDVAVNVPVLIEVLDEEPRVLAFLPRVRSMVAEGLLTLENVELERLTGAAR